MKQYLRIWFDGRTRRRPVTLEIVDIGREFVRGYEVNEEADRVQPAGADDRLHVIQRGAIRASQHMSLSPIYATLIYSGERMKGAPL